MKVMLLSPEDVKAIESALDGVSRLATYIMENVPGEPFESQGAVDIVIRLLDDYVDHHEDLLYLKRVLKDKYKVETDVIDAVDTAVGQLDHLQGVIDALKKERDDLRRFVGHSASEEWRASMGGKPKSRGLDADNCKLAGCDNGPHEEGLYQ